MLPTCDSCNGQIVLDEDRGEFHCLQCGLVQDDHVYADPVDFDDHGNKITEHYGPPQKFSSSATLATSILPEKRDSRGNYMKEDVKFKMHRLATINQRSINLKYKDRAFRTILMMTWGICGRLGLPSVVKERAEFIARKAHEKGMCRGHEFGIFVGASIYLSMHELKSYMPLDELIAGIDIAKKFRPSSKETESQFQQRMIQFRKRQLMHLFNRIKRELNMGVSTFTSSDVFPYVAARLNLDGNLRKASLDELSKIKSNGRPDVDVAVAIYVSACRMGYKQYTERMVTQACGTTGVTLRKRVYDSYEDVTAILHGRDKRNRPSPKTVEEKIIRDAEDRLSEEETKLIFEHMQDRAYRSGKV